MKLGGGASLLDLVPPAPSQRRHAPSRSSPWLPTSGSSENLLGNEPGTNYDAPKPWYRHSNDADEKSAYLTPLPLAANPGASSNDGSSNQIAQFESDDRLYNVPRVNYAPDRSSSEFDGLYKLPTLRSSENLHDPYDLPSLTNQMLHVSTSNQNNGENFKDDINPYMYPRNANSLNSATSIDHNSSIYVKPNSLSCGRIKIADPNSGRNFAKDYDIPPTGYTAAGSPDLLYSLPRNLSADLVINSKNGTTSCPPWVHSNGAADRNSAEFPGCRNSALLLAMSPPVPGCGGGAIVHPYANAACGLVSQAAMGGAMAEASHAHEGLRTPSSRMSEEDSGIYVNENGN